MPLTTAIEPDLEIHLDFHFPDDIFRKLSEEKKWTIQNISVNDWLANELANGWRWVRVMFANGLISQEFDWFKREIMVDRYLTSLVLQMDLAVTDSLVMSSIAL